MEVVCVEAHHGLVHQELHWQTVVLQLLVDSRQILLEHGLESRHLVAHHGVTVALEHTAGDSERPRETPDDASENPEAVLLAVRHSDHSLDYLHEAVTIGDADIRATQLPLLAPQNEHSEKRAHLRLFSPLDQVFLIRIQRIVLIAVAEREPPHILIDLLER